MKKEKKKVQDKTMAHKAVEWWLKKGYDINLKKGNFKKPTPAQYVFTFGKHEGKRITELISDKDLGYCSWMYNYYLSWGPYYTFKYKVFLIRTSRTIFINRIFMKKSPV